MTSSIRFRIATWNLERPRQNGWIKNQRRLDRIREIDADIWVLTETNAAIDLKPDYEYVATVPYQGHKPGENLTTLWSRWRILRCIPTFDPTYAVCAEVESPFGLMLVYGTVITWANDKGISGTAKKWEKIDRFNSITKIGYGFRNNIRHISCVSQVILIKVAISRAGTKRSSQLRC
ncbi:endonuclease/exonuclease/phosphatase family protein [Leptolyngbya sp. FACHB-17]|uniref:endonuclease/exonuclease/phosphatase family protein n=1 Tax=unclassified Leptolyngbya TaxID=2650499 RepID=UPI0016816384|nr:endonuclease/exonuclease/phosphatase family protein [Leptolyngbya sp. FACHB-17]MBD2079441.1 hypothetical protein [Leptolyngbya sp. FACHB-17]